MRQHTKKATGALAAILSLVALAACAKVPKPESDATPPEKVWWSIVDTGAPVEIMGNGSYSAPANHQLTITFHGKDSQGLQAISLTSNRGWLCASGTLVQKAGPGLAANNSATFAPDASNLVPVEAVRRAVRGRRRVHVVERIGGADRQGHQLVEPDDHRLVDHRHHTLTLPLVHQPARRMISATTSSFASA